LRVRVVIERVFGVDGGELRGSVVVLEGLRGWFRLLAFSAGVVVEEVVLSEASVDKEDRHGPETDPLPGNAAHISTRTKPKKLKLPANNFYHGSLRRQMSHPFPAAALYTLSFQFSAAADRESASEHFSSFASENADLMRAFYYDCVAHCEQHQCDDDER